MRRSALLVPALAAVLVITGCGAQPSAKGGAASPEKLFESLKNLDPNSKAGMIAYVAPDDLAILSFSMDFVGAFVTMFVKDAAIVNEYAAIRSRYKLPPQESQQQLDPQDSEAMQAYAREKYAAVDHAGFLKDMEALLAKVPGQTQTATRLSSISALKIDGSTASATVTREDGTTETMNFKRVDGRWYLDITASPGS